MKKSYLFILIPAFLIFLFTSYFSSFFHHFDEHYQIIEFAEYINGNNEPADLAWEYDAQIRPSLQPYIAAFVLKTSNTLGIHNNYTKAFILRIISALFLFFCLFVLFKTLKDDFKNRSIQLIFLCSTFFIYFMPFLSVRFSSETWSSAFFILGFCLLYPIIKDVKKIQNSRLLLTGCLFGISFLLRYQSAILIFGIAVYLIVYNLKFFKNWLVMFMGFTCVFIFGVFLDKLFYGIWTISAYNYFATNLIDNKAAEFGVSPWYWYIKDFIKRDLTAVLNSFISVFMLVFFIVKRNHILTFCSLIFILIHFGIGHKEMRFLYPIAFFIPYFISFAISFFYEKFKQKPLRVSFKIILACLFIINLGFLFSFSIVPAHTPFRVFELMQPYKTKPAKIYYFDWRFSHLDVNPKNLQTNFYLNKNHIGVSVAPQYLDTLLQSNKNNDTLIFAVLTNENVKWKPYFELVGYPTKNWIEAMNKNNFLKFNMVDWGLYKLKDEYVKKNK